VKVWDAATGQELLSVQGHTSHASSVAFSPDGQRLASADERGTVKVCEAATGRELLAFKGQDGATWSVAFSPDGRRLASAGEDRTVRVWDIATGRELLTLVGHTLTVTSVAFRPDGQGLASASADGTVKVWEATVPAPELLLQREAYGLVESLFNRWVRRREVLDHLRRDPTLSEPLRQEGLNRAERYLQSANQLHFASWNVVREPGADPATYRHALLQAEEACGLTPGQGTYLTTLGIAQYRMGRYQAARETLLRADQLNALAFQGSRPADEAFLAMVHHHLGQHEKAQGYWSRLRDTANKPQWARDAEEQGFLREAETLLRDQAKKLDK
jgi:dipeptidyl aminopeptidase/acylaminoacyl peptidase